MYLILCHIIFSFGFDNYKVIQLCSYIYFSVILFLGSRIKIFFIKFLALLHMLFHSDLGIDYLSRNIFFCNYYSVTQKGFLIFILLNLT